MVTVPSRHAPGVVDWKVTREVQENRVIVEAQFVAYDQSVQFADELIARLRGDADEAD